MSHAQRYSDLVRGPVKLPGMCLLALSSPLGVMNILLSQPLPRDGSAGAVVLSSVMPVSWTNLVVRGRD